MPPISGFVVLECAPLIHVLWLDASELLLGPLNQIVGVEEGVLEPPLLPVVELDLLLLRLAQALVVLV